MKFRSRAHSLWQFIKLLRVEPHMFLIAFQLGLNMTPNSQMIQDKICTHWYNTTSQYCHDLPSTSEHDNGPGHFKSRILADVTEFATYQSYVSTPPSIIWALFIGAWIDRYVKARKMILIIACCCGITENLISLFVSISWDTSVYYNLLPTLPGLIICGGSAGPTIAITHYMTSTTPLHLMAVRFMLLQTCLTLALPIGQALGGYILVKEPLFSSGQIRNYSVCYIISLVCEVGALLWTIFVINEGFARKQELKIEMNLRGLKGINEHGDIKLRSDMSKEDKDIHPLKLLFDFENVKSMVRTVIKKRPNKARIQIILLIVSLGIIMGELIGVLSVNNQFIQRVYLWDPDWTSYMASINMAVAALGTLLIVPIVSKLLKVADVPLALFGYFMLCTVNIIKGSWLSSKAYYVSICLAPFGGTALVCSKSHISKIVDRDEMGKVMSFLSTLETIAPMIFTTVFAYIFTNTIDTYPGTVYQVIAALILIPIITMMWIDIYTERPIDQRVKHHDKAENQQDDK